MRKILLPLAALALAAACLTPQPKASDPAVPPAPAAFSAPASTAPWSVAASTAVLSGDEHEALAEQAQKAGHLAEAEAHLRAAIDSHTRNFGANHPKVAHATIKLARLVHLRDPGQARALMGKAWGMLRVGIAAANPIAGLGLDAIAMFYKGQGDHQSAETVYEDSISVMEKKEGAQHPKLVQTYVDLAETYQAQGRHGEAIAVFNKALDAGANKLSPDHPDITRALNGMAASYEARGDLAAAQQALGQAADLKSAPVMARLPDLAAQYDRMAANFGSQGKWDQAVVYYQKEVSLLRVANGDSSATLIPPTVALADAFAKLARNFDAEAQYKGALRLGESVYGKDSANLVSILNGLAGFYQSIGRAKEASAAQARVAAIQATAAAAPSVSNPWVPASSSTDTWSGWGTVPSTDPYAPAPAPAQ